MHADTPLAEINLYNTLTRKTEVLKPLQEGLVTLYCCGPTVYNYQHIGNLRTYIFEDLLARALRYGGYQVKHAMNITDVGHLVSDADVGEDKMLLAARREKKSSMEVADYYTEVFFDHCKWLNIQRPDVTCKATEHVQQMIELVQQIEENGFAYLSDGNVYFDVSKFAEYGELAKLDLSSLQAGARIEVDESKRSPLDFVLWFTKSKFENQELQWDSPWGKGYPGWHIECSAMSMHYLGEQFDIHCGGIDHIPVHHTNEIAQSQSATGKKLASMWLHGGFLVTGKDKMSKSTGEFLTLDVVKDKGIQPLSYRLFCMSGSYRNELVFSWEALQGADNTLKKLIKTALSWKKESSSSEITADFPLSEEALQVKSEFDAAVFNDLNIPKALAVVHGLTGNRSLTADEKLALLLRFDTLLGLGAASWQEKEFEVPQEIMELVEKRTAARAAKNWDEADHYRDKIVELGFVLEDSKDGPIVKPK